MDIHIGLRDKVRVILGGKARQSAREKRDKVRVDNSLIHMIATT